MSWRLAALAMLACGFAAGERAVGSKRGRAAILAAAGGLAASVASIMPASRRPPIPVRPTGWTPSNPHVTFSVVVAARDEAAVLPRLVADIAAQDHRDAAGAALFELLVVDDRSVDGTRDAVAAAARAHGIADVTRVVRREGDGLPDGKGAALTAAPPDACRGDVIVVLDADARVGPRFLSTLAWYVAAGARAVTARRRILGADSSRLAAAQADEQTADGEVQRGRWARGGCSEFRGNGIVVRRDLLAAVGGWRAEALTEDLDLSSRIAARCGQRVAWAIDAEVREEPVLSWTGLWRQRLRWAEGAARRVLEHGPAVLSSGRLPLAARADFAIYAGQLLAPPVGIGVIAGAVRRGRPGPALVLVGAYAAAGSALAWDALRWETTAGGGRLKPPERARRSVRAALFGGIWLAAVPGALWRLASRRGSVRYDKMSHAAAGGAAT